MIYSASENDCGQISYDLVVSQCDRQFTVATEGYLGAWMAKHACQGGASPLM